MQWTDKYRNEYVFILYVCYYYLYFCTEGNRFRAVYGYKSTKCSSHRQPLGVQNNCLYNLYAYSVSYNIYNYILYIHTHTHTHTHTQYRSTHLVAVEHQVELTDVAEELIQHLHKVVDGLKIAEVVVLEVQTEAEIQTSVSLVDQKLQNWWNRKEEVLANPMYVHHH